VKRSRIVFVTIVFTALVTGFLVQRGDQTSPFLVEFTAPLELALEPVVLPRGAQRLAGEVRTAEGRPAPDVTVFLAREEPEPGSAEPVHWAMTDEQGRFAIEELFATSYLATLVLPEHPPLTRTVSIPAEGEVTWSLPNPLPPIEILPEIHRAELTGRILPPVGFDQDALAEGSYEVVVRPAPSTHPLSGAVIRRVMAAADGTFRVEQLVAEDYVVHIMPGWARGGSWPVLGAVYHRHEPVPPPDASLNLRLRSGEIAGGLIDRDGQPLEGALVTIWPAGDTSRIWPPATTDAQGEFVIGDLPESRYRVRVRSGSDAEEVDVSVLIGQRVLVPLITLNPLRQSD